MNVSATLVVEMDKLFIFAPDKLSHYSDIDNYLPSLLSGWVLLLWVISYFPVYGLQ